MAEQDLRNKLADIPLERPGFDALGISAPVLVQMNPEGKWENCKPENTDEKRLRAVVQHLMNSNTVSAAQSYCCQCAVQNQLHTEGNSNYVPVIMMPIFPADQCPFDMECEIQKMKQIESKQTKKVKATKQQLDENVEKDTKKKTHGFVMQRLTDFDLLSQW
ncbi:hypothetical protein K1T71_000066 [Dendrolimus kikuchii]|uniref:Uncharacterized protein n=1 Tax=Dendrolimus kikuchii TaxID=765133 RepID=A0ACC1DJ04_9NEOP|nr:hypothetical protein K1T71_000066 [Dendrolimus kikuchii]